MLATSHNPLRFTLAPTTSPWSNPLITQEYTDQAETGMLPGSGNWPSDALKVQALAAYAETGNQTLAAKSVGLSQSTVRNWVQDEDSLGLVDDLRSTIRYNCGWQISEQVRKMLDKLDVAMDEGDPTVLRDGRIIYSRPKLKDMVISTSILIDKWMLISGAISQSAALVAGLDKISKQVTSLGVSLQPPTLDHPPVTEGTGGENLLW